MRSPFLALLSGSLALGHAIPGKLQARDIGSDELSKFSYWVQYAAASYCYNDYTAKTGASVSCPDNLCSQVEATGATIVYDFSNTTSTDTAGYIALDKTNKAIVLAFRGSYSVRNWIADVEFPYTNPDLCDGCEAELGFWSSWTAVRDPISKTLNETIAANPDYELIVTGHSLGAGVATLAAADLRTKGHPSATLYAYASPRVANSALAKFITAQENNYRFTHINDPVPKLPLLAMGYVHVSPEYYITAPNNATVSASEVKVLQGEVNWDGNTGTGVPSISSFAAHHWYFEEADGCLGPGLPWKV